MATGLVTTIADFATTLASGVDIGATSATLTSATDSDGVALPNGTYGFTIDRKNSSKEYIECTLAGTALTAIKTIARGTGVGTSGFARAHRKGSEVIISDFVSIKRLEDALSSGYPSAVTPTTDYQLATKKYVDDSSAAGGTNATTTTQGLVELAVLAEVTSDAATGATGASLSITPAVLATSKYGDAVTVTNNLTGIISPYGGFTAPTGWLLCDGVAVSRATYPTLFSLINPSLGTATITIASPGVVSLTAHGLVLDDTVYFTTTGALPTGLAINTVYYVISTGLTADAFQLSATKGGSAINTTGSQSGVHTLRRSPYGIGDGTTTFNTPNLKGKVAVGRDASATEFNAVGETGGAKTHTLVVGEIPAHTHDIESGAGTGSGTYNTKASSASSSTTTTGNGTGGGGAHNNLQPYISLNYIIKT